jgi:hypothetical protein
VTKKVGYRCLCAFSCAILQTRTPLTALIGLAEITAAFMKAETMGAGGEQTSILWLMTQQARELSALTNLLDMARTGRDRLRTEWQSTSGWWARYVALRRQWRAGFPPVVRAICRWSVSSMRN